MCADCDQRNGMITIDLHEEIILGFIMHCTVCLFGVPRYMFSLEIR